MKQSIIILLMAALITGCHKETTQQVRADWLIANVNVINTEDGTTLPNAYVAISGDRIDSVYTQKVVLADTTKMVDGTGKYLIPGLWDMHAHLSFNHKYQQGLLVANGVTGVREMWGKMDVIDSIRNQVAKGSMLAPEIYASGTIIGGDPPYQPQYERVANSEDAKRILQKQAAEGVDFFKIYSLLSREAYFAIAEESKRLGIPFGGHVPESISLFEAIDAGQATTEHLMKFLAACSTKEEELSNMPGFAAFSGDKIKMNIQYFNEKRYDSIVNKLAKGNTWLVPTMIVKYNYSNLNDTLKFSINPEKETLINYIPKYTAELWASVPNMMPLAFGENYFDSSQKLYEKELPLLGDMQDKGVKFLAGTDYPNPWCYPGFSLHDELKLMVQGGLSNLEALQTATYNPALFFGRTDEMGNVKKGMMANLVLLNADPLKDISNTQAIAAVILSGEVMDRARLDNLLETSKQLAKEEVNEVDMGGFPLHFHNHK